MSATYTSYLDTTKHTSNQSISTMLHTVRKSKCCRDEIQMYSPFMFLYWNNARYLFPIFFTVFRISGVYYRTLSLPIIFTDQRFLCWKQRFHIPEEIYNYLYGKRTFFVNSSHTLPPQLRFKIEGIRTTFQNETPITIQLLFL